jgi:hypothetical protein
MHCEPLAKHRPQMGCCLLHLTLEAAHASQEARSFGRRSLSEDFGAEVGDLIVGDDVGGVDVLLSSTIGICHSLVCAVYDMVSCVEGCRSRCPIVVAIVLICDGYEQVRSAIVIYQQLPPATKTKHSAQDQFGIVHAICIATTPSVVCRMSQPSRRQAILLDSRSSRVAVCIHKAAIVKSPHR